MHSFSIGEDDIDRPRSPNKTPEPTTFFFFFAFRNLKRNGHEHQDAMALAADARGGPRSILEMERRSIEDGK